MPYVDTYPPLVALDIETTSADPETCELREIGLVPLTREFTIFPGLQPFGVIVANSRPQEPEAAAIHGIPSGEGIPLVFAMNAMRNTIREDWGVPVGRDNLLYQVGHNIAVFDNPVIRRIMGADNFSKFFHYRVRDTSILGRGMSDAGLLPIECGSGKMNLLMTAMGMAGDAGTVHRAVPDAIAEAELYRRMVAALRR